MKLKWLSLCYILLPTKPVVGDFEPGNTVLCRSCGRELADPSYLNTRLLSPLFLERKNLTRLFGSQQPISVEKLRNPAGREFEVVTFDKAGCEGVGVWESKATWFPGFCWRVCVCPQCGSHIGWMFEPEDLVDKTQEKPSSAGFFAFILSQVIDENFADSITLASRPYH